MGGHRCDGALSLGSIRENKRENIGFQSAPFGLSHWVPIRPLWTLSLGSNRCPLQSRYLPSAASTEAGTWTRRETLSVGSTLCSDDASRMTCPGDPIAIECCQYSHWLVIDWVGLSIGALIGAISPLGLSLGLSLHWGSHWGYLSIGALIGAISPSGLSLGLSLHWGSHWACDRDANQAPGLNYKPMGTQADDHTSRWAHRPMITQADGHTKLMGTCSNRRCSSSIAS